MNNLYSLQGEQHLSEYRLVSLYWNVYTFTQINVDGILSLTPYLNFPASL